MKKKCKILAPAGNMDTLKSAIYSGTDHVYLSGEKYGARAYADNFNHNELFEAVKFCHKYNVGVFVTVNTSILESEILDVIDYVYYLYSIGTDAIIVQDIGLAYIINKLIPQLDIHASTQMTIYDYSFIKWLSDNNYDNANISREVPITRIRNISSKLKKYNHNINLEVFIHGALCYSYSGQCLMSSFLGGRSGNRGLCAQPCRMRYTLEDSYHTPLSNSTYLLSTKDLCTYNNLEDIINADIDLVKIEGRMKSKEYIASCVNAYHNIINNQVNEDDFLLLNLAFNRGLTTGYITGSNASNVIGRNTSGSTGYPMGKVVKVDNNKITIKFLDKRYPAKIVNGDGLKFEYYDESCGMYVSKIIHQSKKKVVIELNKNIDVFENSMVYITYSKYLEDKTKEIINNKSIHKTTIDLNINITPQRYMQIICNVDNLKKEIKYTTKIPFQKAKNKPLTKKTINEQLTKTGNTPFTINNITYHEFYDDLFLPLSQLNNIRRNLLDIVDNTLKNSYIPSKEEKQNIKNNINVFKDIHYMNKNKKRETQDKKIITYINNKNQATIVNNYDYINEVYYDGSYNYTNIEDYLDSIYDDIVQIRENIKQSKKLVLILPQLFLDKHLPDISEIILKLEQNNIKIKIQTDNIGIADNLNTDVYASNNHNIYNNYTIEKLSQTPGYKRVVISNEISYEDIKKLNNNHTELEYNIFGNIQVMLTNDDFQNVIKEDITEHYYLTDKKKNKFKVYKDCYNHTHIFDYRILNLEDQIKQIYTTNITHLSINLSFFNQTETKQILEHYQDIIKHQPPKEELPPNNYFQANFQKGLYK